MAAIISRHDALTRALPAVLPIKPRLADGSTVYSKSYAHRLNVGISIYSWFSAIFFNCTQ